MTYEEAIELLDNIKLTYVCDPQDCGLEKDSSTCKAMHCEEYHYALSMAIEALEKQAEHWEMVTEAYRKLDEISFIVRYEVGNRHEIEDKILAVIDGSGEE